MPAPLQRLWKVTPRRLSAKWNNVGSTKKEPGTGFEESPQPHEGLIVDRDDPRYAKLVVDFIKTEFGMK
jgi:hypothetical protein